MTAEAFRYAEVDHVAVHFVRVGDVYRIFSAHCSHRAPYADNPFPYPVIEQAEVDLRLWMLIEQSGVDEVRRLPLHGSVSLLCAIIEVDSTFNQCSVEGACKVPESDKSKVFPYIHFHTQAISALGVVERIYRSFAACHCVSPLDGRIEMFVKQGYRDLFARSRVIFVPEVGIVDVRRRKFCISLYGTAQIEVVEYRRGNFTKLGPVDRTSVRKAQLMFFIRLPAGVDGGKQVVVPV